MGLSVQGESSMADINNEGPPVLTQGDRARKLAAERGLNWDDLSRADRDALIEKVCLAGGLPEKEYHHDNYWKKKS